MVDSSRLVEGRVALVTGGGRGIGRGISELLAANGATVAVNYRRDADAAAETVDGDHRGGRQRPRLRRLGRRPRRSARRWSTPSSPTSAAIDILVCNAGIASRGNAVADTDPAEMIRVVTTHAFGPHHMARLVLPSMRTRGRGDIVMISSVATSFMGPNGAPYNMGKAAMEALALTLAKEERPNGIHVNVVAPGIVETDMGIRLSRARLGDRDRCRTCARSTPPRRSAASASRSTWPTSCSGCAARAPATSPVNASSATAAGSVDRMSELRDRMDDPATAGASSVDGDGGHGPSPSGRARSPRRARCAARRDADRRRPLDRRHHRRGDGPADRAALDASPTPTASACDWRSSARPARTSATTCRLDVVTKAAFSDEVRTVTAGEQTIKVIIPAHDVDLLQGAVLDHTDSQGLVIRNPNRPKAPVVEGLVSDDALSAEIDALVAAEVNPALAAHGGFVTYVGHDGEGTVYMTMGGGCHGCSMSKMTMLDGVQTMLSEQIPAVERVKDLTDHTTGENPFYS